MRHLVPCLRCWERFPSAQELNFHEVSLSSLGRHLGGHLGFIFGAKVVTGAIVGAQGLPEHLKTGVSNE